MNYLSTKRRMKLMVVFKSGSSMTRELICLHLGNHRKMTCHLHCIREVWSYAFSLNQTAGCSAVSLFLILFLSLCQCSQSLAVWSVFPLIHVTHKEEMINMWLQVGSREASDGWKWHFMDRLSHLLVWSICWAFLCMVSWQMERFVQRHIRCGAGTSNCRL